MKSYLIGLGVMVAAGSLQTLSAAEISGKVKLDGTPKPEVEIQMDQVCGKMHQGKVTTRHYVVGADKGLANVFVYIKQGAKKTPAAADAAPMIDQVGCMYEPYVVGAVAGQEVAFRNSDPLLHNVHATPKVNKEFNIAQPIKGQVTKRQFSEPEVLVRVKCDVHPWMFSYVGVQDHPYFAVTDKDGNFTIKNVPAGTYTVEAYHLKAGAKTQELTVSDSDKKTADFTLSVPAQ
jgi:plastocyanin